MEPFIGSIQLFAGNFEPKGWAFCDGREILISENTALFSIIGNMYGGNGTTHFALPDLRGNVPIHPFEKSEGEKPILGQKGGKSAHELMSGKIFTDANSEEGAKYTVGIMRSTINSNNNMPPFTTINYIIALEGVFPVRL